MPTQMSVNYDDHELLALEDITKEPYVTMVIVGGGLIERIPQEWVCGIYKAMLLGLISMSHSGWMNVANVEVK